MTIPSSSPSFMRILRYFAASAVLFALATSVTAQTPVILPPTNATGPACQVGFVDLVAGADNGAVYFYWGGFFMRDGVEWFGTDGVGCSNFLALQFGPKATGVTFTLHNFSLTADTITVGLSTGFVTYSVPAQGDVTITDPGPVIGINFQSNSRFPAFAILNLSVAHQGTASTLELAGTMETPGSAYTTYSNPSSQTTVMNVPLGAFFSVGMQKKSSQLLLPTPITTTLSLGATTVEPWKLPLNTATVMPKVVPLYPNRALVGLDDAVGADVHHFVAVHLGTTAVTLLPVSTDDPQKTFMIRVIKPDALGSSQHAPWDEYYINVAHNSGIPPQFLKGQGRQEGAGSLLIAANWRYEICKDYEEVGGNSSGLAYVDSRFIPFRLDNAIGQTLHENVLDELDPRNRFWIKRLEPSSGLLDRHIVDTDLHVTAREIWDDNDSHHYRQNWSLQCQSGTVAAIAAAGSTALDFVAQTPTSQSSGIQQVMWEEASQPAFWDGVHAGGYSNVREPKYAFDRIDYINVGGGSVQIAANKLASFWTTSATTFTDRNAYLSRLNKMFRKYNYWWLGVGPDSQTVKVRYGTAVMQWGQREIPQSAGLPVFQ